MEECSEEEQVEIRELVTESMKSTKKSGVSTKFAENVRAF